MNIGYEWLFSQTNGAFRADQYLLCKSGTLEDNIKFMIFQSLNPY